MNTIDHIADNENLSLPKEGITLMEFHASWSPFQNMTDIILNKVKIVKPDVNIKRADIEKRPELASQYNVSTLPTLLIFKGKVIIAKLEGVFSKKSVIDAINRES